MGNKKIIAIILVEGFLMGLSIITTKKVLEVIGPMDSNACRWGIAAIGAVIFSVTGIIKVDFRNKPIWQVVLIGILLPCIYSTLETIGISCVSTSESAMLLGLPPVMVMLISIIVFKKKENKMVYLGIAMAFIGVLFTIDFTSVGGMSNKGIGILILFMSVVVNSIYVLFSSSIGKKFTGTEITVAMCIIGGIWFNGLALMEGKLVSNYVNVFSTIPFLVSVLYLGIICSILCYSMLNYALGNMESHKVVMISINTITIVGVLSGVIFGGDPLNVPIIVGVGLILIGIYLVSTKGEE